VNSSSWPEAANAISKLRQPSSPDKSSHADTQKTTAKIPTKTAAATSKSASVALGGKEGAGLRAARRPTEKTVALKDLIGAVISCCISTRRTLTPGCTIEACSFRDNIAPIKKLGARVVGVSGDSTDSHGKFIAKHDLNFPLLADPGNKVCKLYGVYKMKSL